MVMNGEFKKLGLLIAVMILLSFFMPGISNAGGQH